MWRKKMQLFRPRLVDLANCRHNCGELFFQEVLPLAHQDEPCLAGLALRLKAPSMSRAPPMYALNKLELSSETLFDFGFLVLCSHRNWS